DDRVHPEARGGEDGAEILEDAAGFVGDGAVDQRAGRGIERDLAGKEEHAAGGDRLTVRTDGARRGVGRNRALHARTRDTFITPFTLPRPRMTRFRASTLSTITSKVLRARLSGTVRTWAPVMLTPAPLMALLIAARRPGESMHVTSTCTGRN